MKTAEPENILVNTICIPFGRSSTKIHLQNLHAMQLKINLFKKYEIVENSTFTFAKPYVALN